MEYSAVSTIWIMVGTVLIFFMQAGFAMLETGMTRVKNAGNIAMKNLVDYCIGSVTFWLIGFGIMYGGDGAVLGKIKGVAMESVYGGGMLPDGIPFWAFLIFQTVFAATAATIVSGAMAARTKFAAYCIYSLMISLVIYPISGHWIWGDGWLAQLGFHDLAGSTVVHMVGGAAAFAGAWMLGPRIGKYSRSGKSKKIPGHSMPLSVLGIFILWFGWFGFNAGSALAANHLAVHAMVTTQMAAAAGVLGWLLVEWKHVGKPTSLGAASGALAGLVAITPAAGFVDIWASLVIGLVGGIVCYVGVLCKNRLGYDDALDVVGIHGVGGTWGALATGIFAVSSVNGVDGLLYGNPGQLWVQFVSVVGTWGFVYVASLIILRVVDTLVGLRVAPDPEIAGLDMNEHNERAYQI